MPEIAGILLFYNLPEAVQTIIIRPCALYLHAHCTHELRSFLCNRGDDERSDAVFLCAHRDLGGHAALGAVRHAHVGNNFAAIDGLAEKLESVGSLVDWDVGAFQGLQGEDLGELFRCLCCSC